jgi:1-aminocyclopropane-1-carboxylate deaminase/D-cysteine desulfhydrase-like pyridoxal-dependent ACC family enzyme
MFDVPNSIPIVKINDPLLEPSGVELFIKREDLIDIHISGNKYRKLKYNLEQAAHMNYKTLLTFGGAYSNHIHAVAYAGFRYGFETIGVIRGEQTLPINPTLRDAGRFGMKIHYISRADYRNKHTVEFIKGLESKFGHFYLIPEGGSNALAVKGCVEIVDEHTRQFDHICCPVGTGGTLAGLVAGMAGQNKIWGFPALKNGAFLTDTIMELLNSYNHSSYQNWGLIMDYHFGGYAKYSGQLIEFINKFKERHKIPLDPIYTGKMLYGIYDLITKSFFKRGEKVLAIHTGGLQGVNGFNERFGNLIR